MSGALTALAILVREELARGDLPRFGQDKVFLGPLAERLADRLGQDVDAVKADLISAHRARLLELSRADLVSAMDPDLVRRSETRLRVGRIEVLFHFVRRPVVRR